MVKVYAALILTLLASTAAAEEYMGLEWNYTTAEIMSGLAVGDVTGDGHPEVVVSGSSDGRVYLLDGKGGLVWKRDVFSYINTVAVVDVDADGSGEAIGGHSDLTIFDKDGKSWKFRTSHGVHEIVSGDVNGDGTDDIVVASYDKGSCRRSSFIQAINGKKKEELWKYSVGKDIPHSLAVADLDRDGKDEVIVGLIYRATASNRPCEKIYAHESAVLVLSGNELLWQYETGGAVISLATGDVTGDGTLDVIAGSYPTLYVIDSTGDLVWENRQVIVSYVEDVTAADLDGDNKSEVIAGSDKLHVLNPEGKVVWTGLTDARVYSVATGDLDEDDVPEVIAGSASIYVFDADGSQLWRSPSHTSYGFVAAADLDGQGYDEIIAGSIKNVYVYRTQGYARKVRADELYGKALLLGNSNPELAVEKLREARGLYSELGLIDKVSDCINQIQRLSDSTGRIEDLRSEADLALNQSEAFMDACDYLNASRYAQIARSKYSSLNDRTKVGECRVIIDDANAKIAHNASQELVLANISYHAGEYQESLEHARRAVSYYSFLGDIEHAEKAGVLVSNLSAMLGIGQVNETGEAVVEKASITERLKAVKPIYIIAFFIFVVLIAILAAVAVYLVRARGRTQLRVEHLHRVQYTKGKAEAPPPAPLRGRREGVVGYKTTLDEEKTEVKLPPNKGVFKSKMCGEGLCLKMTRLKKKR